MKSCIKVDLDPMKHLAKALQLDPANPQAAYLFAETLIQKKDTLKAIHFLKDFHYSHGLSDTLHNLLAKAYLVEKDFSNAEDANGNALSKSPRNKGFLETAFRIKEAKGDKFSALHFLERIIRYGTESFEIYWEMSNLLTDPAERIKRINVLEIAYSLNQSNHKIYKTLIGSYCDYFESIKYNKSHIGLFKTFKDRIETTNGFDLPPPLKDRFNQIFKQFEAIV